MREGYNNNKTMSNNNINSINKYSFKGEWSYRFVDQEGNQVGEEVVGTNIVTKSAYDAVFANLGAAFSNTGRVFIGPMGLEEKFNRTVVNATTVGTLQTYVFTPRVGLTNPYADWECRINFTGTRRIFRSIGLSNSTAPTARQEVTSTLTVTNVSSNTITVSISPALSIGNAASRAGIIDCWITKDSLRGESGYQVLSLTGNSSSITITFTEPHNNYFQIGDVVYVNNNVISALAYSKIDPVKYALTLTNISGNNLTFSITDTLNFGTNSLAQQYISSTLGNDFGTPITGNTLIQSSDTSITVTVGNSTGYTIGNTYYLVIYPVQEANITLFVKYRISINWDDNYGNTFPDFKYSLENRIFNVGTAITLNHASYGYGNPDTILEVTNKLSNRNAYTPTHSITSTTFNTSHMHKRVFPSPVTDGILYNYIMLGNDPNTGQAIWFKGVENTRSPIQNQFPHSSIHLQPFYSSTAENLPQGSLKPIVSGNWTEWAPHMYEFVIAQPGLIGQSTYKIRQYAHIMGTNGNDTSRGNSQLLVSPLLSRWNTKSFPTKGRVKDMSTFLIANGGIASESIVPQYYYSVDGTRIPFGKFGFIQCSPNSFTIVENIYEGVLQNYSSANYPILNNLNITQISIAYYNTPNIVWIACRNNGLFKLDFDTQIITLVVAEPCYGVAHKVNGDTVALFDSGFRISTDNFASNIGDATGIIRSEVKFIKLDEAVIANTRVICCGKDAIDDLRDLWYFWSDTAGLIQRTVSPHTTAGSTVFYNVALAFRGIHTNFTFNTFAYNQSSGNFLICPYGVTTLSCNSFCRTQYYVAYTFMMFTSNSTVSINNYSLQQSNDTGKTLNLFSFSRVTTPFKGGAAASQQVGGPISGNTASRGIDYFFPAIHAGLTSWNLDAYANSCALYNTYDINDNRCIYISENTITRFPYELREPFFINTWGWNSTTGQWELDSGNLLPGKPTHSTAQPIIDGLEVRWSELSPEQPYAMSTGEYFNVFVNHGMFKDPYITNPTYTFYFTMRPTVQFTVNTVIGAGLTYQLPFVNDDALFAYVLLDGNDTKLLHNVSISGYGSTVESITVGTTTTGPNRIAINSERGGLITFNAADVGKTFTGTITYTRKYHSTEVIV